jgi:uncharacterized protein YjbI with pentapeptide repeats
MSHFNFRGQDLKGRSFVGKDLTGSNFREADISGCDFTGAILHYCNFKDAKQDGTIFTDAKVQFSVGIEDNSSADILTMPVKSEEEKAFELEREQMMQAKEKEFLAKAPKTPKKTARAKKAK